MVNEMKILCERDQLIHLIIATQSTYGVKSSLA